MTTIYGGRLLRLRLAMTGSLLLVSALAQALPSFSEVKAHYRKSDAVLLDRNGEVLHELRVDRDGRRLAWVALSAISPAIARTLVAAEDKRFYRHGGVDWLATASAIARQLFTHRPRGASTLTMQLAAFLDGGLRPRHGRRSFLQKLRQMREAWELESFWRKDEILEAYLNLVTFRGELRGIAAATRGLLGKDPQGVTVDEAVLLAALVRSPNAGAPHLLGRACPLGAKLSPVVECEAITATARRILVSPPVIRPDVALAPHVARILLEERGKGKLPMARSTLDGRLQAFALEALQRHLLSVRGQNVQDGAVLVVENKTGEVLAYVGNAGRLSSQTYVDGIPARRQAGSTLKPFLYGLAFERRLLTAASLIDDSPINVAVDHGTYRPQNYDNHFHGLVTARTALASSLNIPAVKTLLLIGPDAFVRKLNELGFSTLEDGDYYGPSLALGSADVSLWQLVNAYRTLANDGLYSPLRLAPEDPIGPRHRAFTVETAYLISDILSDRESRSLTFGLENPLATRFWTAVKTGTSKDMRDNWCVGYSEKYTVGVWAGNFSGQPMWNVSGITGAAPVWIDLMNRLHRREPSHAKHLPPSLVVREVEWRPLGVRRKEIFLAGTEATLVDTKDGREEPRILYPSEGTIVAIDPDIPKSQQKLFFEAEGARRDFRWRLNQKDLGPAGQPVLWTPVAGQYRLALMDSRRHEIDAVSFEVRGSAE